MTIGIALDNYSGSDEGEILVFMNIAWFDPNHALTIDASGKVGIGTPGPTSTLEVAGTIATSGSVSNGVASVDWSRGNIQHTALNCQAITFANMRDGATYSLAVKGSSSGTCSFSQDGMTFHMPSNHGPTTASSRRHTIYTFLVSGADVYVAWVTGI